jgi:hypothetical protein
MWHIRHTSAPDGSVARQRTYAAGRLPQAAPSLQQVPASRFCAALRIFFVMHAQLLSAPFVRRMCKELFTASSKVMLEIKA